uniref:NADH-ubiquinone oxidoreductase chain 1 n=1 Tax=Syrista parreyssii TaxID=1090889 RepID=A0A8K1TMY5_9HYME|nr:NADH dehydrogenase subunit 1 [Syrista parreyssii]
MIDMIEYIMVMLSYMILMINVLVGVAFLTLYERKLLGYAQMRKGPNKLGFIGLFQPFSDAIKLFNKESLKSVSLSYWIYLMSPVFMLMISLFIWVLVPNIFNMWSMELGVLFMLSLMSISVYSVVYSGWASNSIYSTLGMVRSIAQSISYEVSLALILIIFVFLIDSFNLYDMVIFQLNLPILLYLMPMVFIFISSSIAELNRSPFDFVEGESELVSGYNVEYAGGLFAFLFLAEYAMILFTSMVWMIMFVGFLWFNFFCYFYIVLFFSLIIFIRGAYPRFRYDKLMYLSWKIFLPFVLFYFIYVLGVKFLFFFLMN